LLIRFNTLPFVEEKRWPFSAWLSQSSAIDKAIAPYQESLDTEVKKNAQLSDAIADLQKQLNPRVTSPPSDSVRLGNISTISDDQLKSDATEFIDELRKFEARFQLQERGREEQEFAAMANVGIEPQETRHKLWSDNAENMERRLDQHRAEYDVRFRKTVLIYKEQICTRVEFTSPCPTSDPALPMIDSNVGALFVGMIADYMTKITGLLHR
jgi:hypothetical protein